MIDLEPPMIATAAGFTGGIALGLAARWGRFCTLGAIEDAILAGNTLRLRSWVLAMAVAIIGVVVLSASGFVTPSDSFLADRPLNIVALVCGGTMFGIGMALVGTCGFGTLVRLGGGDLKSFLVFLVIGISAYMAAAGPTALFYQHVLAGFSLELPWLDVPLLGPVLEDQIGLPPLATGAACAVLLSAWALSHRQFRRSAPHLAVALVVGLVIAWGWFATSYLASDPFEPAAVSSYTFIRSLGASVLYLMASSGTEIGFGVGATAGVLLGSFIAALQRSEFRWEASDDVVEQKRQIIGAFLMGTGGMFALGCTVGQGLTAVSILALSAPIVLASIWLGAWLGLNYIVEGTFTGALRAIAGRPMQAPGE